MRGRKVVVGVQTCQLTQPHSLPLLSCQDFFKSSTPLYQVLPHKMPFFPIFFFGPIFHPCSLSQWKSFAYESSSLLWESNRDISHQLWRRMIPACVLNFLKRIPKRKAQRQQYPLALGLSHYKWYRAKHRAICQRGGYTWKGSGHEAICQQGRWTPKGRGLWVRSHIG